MPQSTLVLGPLWFRHNQMRTLFVEMELTVTSIECNKGPKCVKILCQMWQTSCNAKEHLPRFWRKSCNWEQIATFDREDHPARLDNRQVKDFSGLPDLWIVPILCYNVGGEGIVRYFFSFPRFQELYNLVCVWSAPRWRLEKMQQHRPVGFSSCWRSTA